MPTPLEAQTAALRKHLEHALYPELAEDIEAVQRAITATAAGRSDERITFASGRVEEAVMVCAVLDLEPFIEARTAVRAEGRLASKETPVSDENVMRRPHLSEEAQRAAREWEDILKTENEKQSVAAAAELAFQEAERASQEGERQVLERFARNWAEAGLDLGYVQCQLNLAMERFLETLVACGVPEAEAGWWHPRHVLAMRVGDEFAEKPGPVPLAPLGLM